MTAHHVIPLIVRPQTCHGCGNTPAPFVPIVFLRNNESFELPQTLCDRCVKTIRRDRVLTPPIVEAAVTRLYAIYGTSDLQLLDPVYWRLAHIERTSYGLDLDDVQRV
jgi:hypothetical protein